MSETLKAFADLHEDYAFFERHVNETEATLAAWLPLVRDRWSSVRALDFGCGSGSFSAAFLEAAAFPPERFQLTLVEPDSGFRHQALRRLAAFSSSPIQAWPLLDRDLEPSFELIFSHHVLYYVPALEETLARLVGALVPGGRLLIVQGGQGNGMNRLVRSAFEHLGETSPYHYSEDTARCLQRLGVAHQVAPIASVLDFEDQPESRHRLLRFLLSQHLERLSPETRQSLFEPFLEPGRVRIASRDELFVIDA